MSLKYEPRRGFPDDSAAYGPTLVSNASLRKVQTWYAAVSFDNVRRRFRTNVELVGGDAFCEDALFGAPGELRPFRLGGVAFLGHNPCQRCVVPTRDPETGEVTHGFQKSFATFRQNHLPPWADVRRFNHFYRFAVNTSIPAVEVGQASESGRPAHGLTARTVSEAPVTKQQTRGTSTTQKEIDHGTPRNGTEAQG